MKILSTSLLIFLIFISCNSTKELGGKTFKYKSKKRTLELIFDNDSICRLKNRFYCNDIDSNLRELTIDCKYERKRDTIYVKNINCKDENCVHSLFVSLPPQKSKQCTFLNIESRKVVNAIGPRYQTIYEKYGLVPNVDIDTLYIVKNKIVFAKHDKEMILWFIFK